MIGRSKKNQRNRGSRTRVNVVFISPISQKLMPTSPTMQLDHRQLIFFTVNRLWALILRSFLAFKRCQDIHLSLLFFSQTVCVTSQLRACILSLRMFLEAQIFSTHLWILCACKILLFFRQSHTWIPRAHFNRLTKMIYRGRAEYHLTTNSKAFRPRVRGRIPVRACFDPILFTVLIFSTQQYQNPCVFQVFLNFDTMSALENEWNYHIHMHEWQHH